MTRSERPNVRDTMVDLAPRPTADGDEVPVVFAGRYEANGVLGGGAMGTVYRTRDRALDEIVALKLLRKELAVSPDFVERFRREVKLSRRVTHRNIARVFDIGAHGPQPFLTMELIEGTSLAEVVSRRGRLEPREVVSTAIELCAGLSAAHTAGVVHRDLKPENVIVAQGGRPVITDFSIASTLSERDLPHGAMGAFVGSPAYMSPEQVEGLPDIDARADVYALGVMLYELLTGHLPWENGSLFAVAAARLVKAPPDPRERVPDLPAELAELVLECMARRREDRCPNAEDVAQRLRNDRSPRAEISIPPPTMEVHRRGGQRTVAVMPVINMVGADVDYFCQGFAAELVDFLGAMPRIYVRHALATSAFAPSDEPRESARALGVHTVVSGNLVRVADGLRFVARLVTVQDGLTLWSKRWDGASVVDLALAAREASLEIGQVLASGHAGAPETADDPRAHDLHMRGRFLYQRAWFEANDDAVKLLHEAHALAPADPGIAGSLALALARAYGLSGAGESARATARTIAETALADAPQLASPRLALAAHHAYDAEGVAAATELRRAIDVAPDMVEALDWMGTLLAEVGETERGLVYLDRVIALEPTMVASKLTATLVRALVGDWDRVAQELANPPPDDADRVLHWIYRARVALWHASAHRSSDAPKAPSGQSSIDAMSESSAAHPAVGALLHIMHTRSIDEQTRAMIDRLAPVDAGSPRRIVYNAQFRAEVFAHAGLFDEASAALRDADAHGLSDVVWLERCPALEPLRESAEAARIGRNVSARAARIRAALMPRTRL